jgi:hypothetical protein
MRDQEKILLKNEEIGFGLYRSLKGLRTHMETILISGIYTETKIKETNVSPSNLNQTNHTFSSFLIN